MKGINAAASVLFALGLMALGGCEESTIHVDPLSINGRDATGDTKPIDYATLMRIGAAAHAGGDLATAVGVYRRASALDPGAAAPLAAAGNTLLDMGNIPEALVAYNSALTRAPHDPEALRGLGRADLMSGKPQLAGQPLGLAYHDTPNDPKLLQLIGVADDFAGQHEEAQARYRRGLELRPGDPGLLLDLALSLAITGDYAQAIAVLQPIAMALTASPHERQTLAMLYALQGNRVEAERLGRLDLDPQTVQRNLAYYDTLRRLSPEARSRAIQTLSTEAAGSAATKTAPAAHNPPA